jgi:hypothetical protein
MNAIMEWLLCGMLAVCVLLLIVAIAGIVGALVYKFPHVIVLLPVWVAITIWFKRHR